MNFAKIKLKEDALLKNTEKLPITFKSNDFIIREAYLNKYFKNNNNLDKFLKLRDEKRIKYTKQALDGSIEEHERVLDNIEFLKTLENKSFNIIF